jgi:hypothetical protein
MTAIPPSPGLPSIHDLSPVAVVTGLERWDIRRQQVLLVPEGLIARRDHAAAQPP